MTRRTMLTVALLVLALALAAYVLVGAAVVAAVFLTGSKVVVGVATGSLGILAEAARRGLPTAWGQATCPAVFTGPDTAQAHYSPTGRTVEPGHVLNMDFGVKVEGYCSDMQRTFYVLAPGETAAPEDVLKGFRKKLDENGVRIPDGVRAVATSAIFRRRLDAPGPPSRCHVRSPV